MNTGTKRERRDRECGLTFAWRIPESSKWAGILSFFIVALLTTVLFATVRVSVMPTPRVIERKATATLVPDWGDGRAWALRAEEEGPFPAAFDPAESVEFQTLEAKAFAELSTKSCRAVHLKDLPDETDAAALPVAVRGERVFPAQPTLEEKVPPTELPPLVPSLTVLSKLPPDSLPRTFPDFDGPVTPAMAAATWHFTLEIGKGGRVKDLTSLEGGDEGASKAIGDWLAQVRFGPGAAGWIGVEVGFNRKP